MPARPTLKPTSKPLTTKQVLIISTLMLVVFAASMFTLDAMLKYKPPVQNRWPVADAAIQGLQFSRNNKTGQCFAYHYPHSVTAVECTDAVLHEIALHGFEVDATALK